MLDGITVLEVADERAEYVGLVLAGLGANVIKVEPPGGSPTRAIGPFLDDESGTDRSLHFWAYNRGKRSVVLDLDRQSDRDRFAALAATSDVVVESTPAGYLEGRGLGLDALRRANPALITARMTDFGDDGPWAGYKASDLVHMALGGQMMSAGYTPPPGGTYDLPPIAAQAWHSTHVAGEQLTLGIVAALYVRDTTGSAQHLSCAIHDATAKNTELDVMNWVFRRVALHRQTAYHAAVAVAPIPPIVHTKDGRWFAIYLGGDTSHVARFLASFGLDPGSDADGRAEHGGRSIPGSHQMTGTQIRMYGLLQALFGRFTYTDAPWREAQAAGLLIAPVRHPEENAADPHWWARDTFTEVEHPELGRSFTYVTSKWRATGSQWQVGRRAPLLDEDGDTIRTAVTPPRTSAPVTPSTPRPRSARRSFAFDGIRVFDFSWFLASAGGTRFLAGLGAEVIKVEWAAHPDSRVGVMAPVGGRAAREAATAPLPGVTDSDMGGQFNNKNTGKRGISLNVTHPEGLAIARRLVGLSDVVAEGFSPGVMDRWGLGYDDLRAVRPDIIYACQSGMGTNGLYGRFRANGPIAAAFAGLTDMSGLPEPALPAGWGYSYLDWIGAYSFGLSIASALFHRARTGEGQWIDASQVETGIFLASVPILDHSANGRGWRRVGNRSAWRPAAPHGAFRCAGEDRWIAIAVFSDEEWRALCRVAGAPPWAADRRFATMADRLAHQDELEEVVGSWTVTQERYALMAALQEAGVAAGVCQDGGDKVDLDPQLDALGWLTEVTGTKIGRWPVGEMPFSMSATPPYAGGTIDRGAPCYGEDNEYVYGELLGLDTKTIGRLHDDGVI